MNDVQKSSLYTPEFESWYAHYPRKESKLAAQRAFTKALKQGVTIEHMTEGVKNFVAHLEASPREKKYIPLPATWLNAGKYDDEYETRDSGGLDAHARLRWEERYRKNPDAVPRDMKRILGLGEFATEHQERA